MDRRCLSPQWRLHPGAVDEVSGLPQQEGSPRRSGPRRPGLGQRRERAWHHRHRSSVPDLQAPDLLCARRQ